MRLLPSVSPRMYGQGATLDEAFVAILDGTMIRAFIGMYTIMATKVGLAIKRLATVLPRAVEIAPTTGRHDFELPAAVTGCGGEKRVAGRRRGGKSEREGRGVEAHGTRAKRPGIVLVRPDI